MNESKVININEFRNKKKEEAERAYEAELHRGILRRINHLLPEDERIPDED